MVFRVHSCSRLLTCLLFSIRSLSKSGSRCWKSCVLRCHDFVAFHTLHRSFPAHLPIISDEEQRKALNDMKDQQDVVRDAVQQARALCTTTISSFVQALANALPQYAANGITDFLADPWWVSMTSYFKASLWLFAAVPGVPLRRLAEDYGDGTGKQRILDANEVEALVSSAGCQEYVGVSKRLWWIHLFVKVSPPSSFGERTHATTHNTDQKL